MTIKDMIFGFQGARLRGCVFGDATARRVCQRMIASLSDAASRRVSVIILSACLAAVVGCSKSEDAKSTKSLPPSVIFTYAGGCYTESQRDEDVKLREFMMREIITNHKGEIKRFETDLPKLRPVWRDEVLVQSVVMASAQVQAARDKVVPSAKQRDAAKKLYGERVGNKTVDFAALRKKADAAGVRAAFDAKFEQELTLQALRESVLRGDLGYGETNVCIFLTNVTNDARRAEAKNVEIYLMATNVVKRLRAGENFYKVYDECCNLPAEDKKLTRKPDEYDPSDFAGEEDGKEMWEMLKALPDNGVSEVLETNDGLVIYKVLQHVAESEQTKQFALKMNKIVIRRVVVRDIPSVEEARKMVKKCFADDALEQKMKAAFEAAQIDFGAGVTNLSPRVRQQLTEMGMFKEAK